MDIRYRKRFNRLVCWSFFISVHICICRLNGILLLLTTFIPKNLTENLTQYVNSLVQQRNNASLAKVLNYYNKPLLTTFILLYLPENDTL